MKAINNRPFVTYGLLAIMIIMFLVMTINGGTTDSYNLVLFGAKYNPLIRAGEYWRLFTPIFIHIGFTHLLMNSITLYFIGPWVERFFGHWRFLLLFLLSGVLGNLASFAFSPNISAGASTSIFGLFGAFMMLGESFSENQIIRALARNFLLFVVLNIVTDLFISGIDIYGHLGGLIGGFLLGYIVGVPGAKVNIAKRIVALITLIIVATALFILGMRGQF